MKGMKPLLSLNQERMKAVFSLQHILVILVSLLVVFQVLMFSGIDLHMHKVPSLSFIL